MSSMSFLVVLGRSEARSRALVRHVRAEMLARDTLFSSSRFGWFKEPPALILPTYNSLFKFLMLDDVPRGLTAISLLWMGRLTPTS